MHRLRRELLVATAAASLSRAAAVAMQRIRLARRVGTKPAFGAVSVGALAGLGAVPGRVAADDAGVIRVGPREKVRSIAEAARIAADGDVVEIEAGDYPGDTAVWLQKRLTIRAVGGAVRIPAAGVSAEDKAIWVIRNGDFSIDGIEFSGTRVPDQNGAGIRFEGGHLRLSRCRFFGNQMGLLTSNDPGAILDVVGCEFSANGEGAHGFRFARRSSIGHGLYVGRIRRLSVQASYFSAGRVGHLLKTRAQENRILYNRLTDESGGYASYELEFPNGGDALVMGNLLVQEAGTHNPTIVSYGAEGLHWEHNALVVAHNTIVNRLESAGVFVRVHGRPSEVRVRNNLLVGAGRLIGVPEDQLSENPRASESDFSAPQAYDFTPKPGALPLIGTGAMPPDDKGTVLPRAEYRHPMRLRSLEGAVRVPGAFQR